MINEVREDAVLERFIYGFFCEQVRREASDQYNFIGVFNRTYRSMKAFPFRMVSLCCVIGFVIPDSEELGETSIEITTPDGVSRNGGPISLPPKSEKTERDGTKKFTLIMKVEGFSLKRAGDVTVSVINNNKIWYPATLTITSYISDSDVKKRKRSHSKGDTRPI